LTLYLRVWNFAQTLTGAMPLDPAGDFRLPDPLILAPSLHAHMKLPRAAYGSERSSF